MKKFVNTVIFLFVIVTSGYAQQIGTFSTHLGDDYYLLNPAATGRTGFNKINLGYRQQWSGLDQASPSTYYVAGYARLGTSKLKKSVNVRSTLRFSSETFANRNYFQANPFQTVGGIVYSDNFGAFTRTLAHGTYAYHLPLGKRQMLAMGARVGYSNFSLDVNKLYVGDVNDPIYQSLLNSNNSEHVLDFGLGLWFYSNRFFMGYSTEQLFESNVDSLLSGSISLEKQGTFVFLSLHHYAIAGYRFILGNASVTPSVVGRLSRNNYSIDMNLRLAIQEKFWIAAAYRDTGSILSQVGLAIGPVSASYSFEYPFSNSNLLGIVNEVNLGFKIKR